VQNDLKTPIRILLLGATGRTGSLALSYALEKGYQISCLVRDAARVQFQGRVDIFEGDVSNLDDLSRAIQGCDAAISILNISRTSDFPWSPLRTPPTLLSNAMSSLIPLAKENNLERIISCSAWGVGDSEKEIPGWFRWFIKNSNIGVAYADHAKQEDLLRDSGLPYTIVRPTGLTNSDKSQGVRESFENKPRPRLTISRKTVARYLIDAIERSDLKNKHITVSAEK
jgi:uncharacterized protein YbjT (DUF2867 family)